DLEPKRHPAMGPRPIVRRIQIRPLLRAVPVDLQSAGQLEFDVDLTVRLDRELEAQMSVEGERPSHVVDHHEDETGTRGTCPDGPPARAVVQTRARYPAQAQRSWPQTVVRRDAGDDASAVDRHKDGGPMAHSKEKADEKL